MQIYALAFCGDFSRLFRKSGYEGEVDCALQIRSNDAVNKNSTIDLTLKISGAIGERSSGVHETTTTSTHDRPEEKLSSFTFRERALQRCE